MLKRRSPLFSALLMLILCASVLVGSTYAQFTDQVVVTGNVITSGNLKASLDYWTKDAEGTGKWSDAENTTIFDYTYWEPGYTDVQYIRIKNTGKLAFQYALSVEPVQAPTQGAELPGEEGQEPTSSANLMDAIDVYYGMLAPDQNMNAVPMDRIEFMSQGFTKIGTLTQLNQMNSYTWDHLSPGGEAKACIVLHMQEEAGNEYMNLPATSFNLKLTATQYAEEEDAFGKDYDDIQMELFTPISLTINLTENMVADGVLLEEQTATDPNTGAEMTVPAGAKIAEGATRLTLNASMMSGTGSNVQLGEGEAMRSYDVHVDGLAADNEEPLQITLPELMDKALNIGNYRVYHVENGATTPMTHVSTAAGAAHNSFTYDPATGDVTLCMATYSEVAVVAEESKWEGEFDYSWYTNAVMLAEGEAVTEYTIANADQLAAFGAIVGGMNGQTQDSFAGKTVKLIADINLNDAEGDGKIFYPIGYYNSTKSYTRTDGSVTSTVNSFEGTFDGQGHTIANFYQNTWEMFGDYNQGYPAGSNYYKDAMGLFGYVKGGTVKNLTVDNFKSDGEFTPTGVIAAYADGNATFENIAITNCNPRVYNTGNGGIIGIAGDTDAAYESDLTLTNITVDNSNKISALWGSYDVACGGLVGMYRGNVDGNGNATGDTIKFDNCHVSAVMDVYNDVCGNYQYYAYRYAGMIIGSVRHNTTNTEGKTIPNMAGISATGCTVNYGDWNDYYYCEFVKNGHPSYSGPDDYKFSRVPHSELNFTDTNSNGVVDANERASVDGCKHNHTDAENNNAIYLPFHQLFTGYGWGVNSIGLEEYSGIVTNLDITEGDKEESVEKFETKFTGDFLYRVGNQNTVSLGSLFAAKGGATISNSGVVASIEKVDEDMNVGGTFTANTSDWTKGTIQFSGTGVVKVTIQDYNFCTPTVLYLEVVDAYNRTTASFSGNSVLLNDVSTSSSLSTSGVIYGNGFTVNMENAPISEKNGAVFHLYDGAVLKNLGIVGKEFTTVATTVNDTNYGVSAVRAWGTVTIENCYISGCRSAVSVTGSELTIKDSVVANGVYANVDFRSGILNLHNVTTINEPHTVNGTTIVGLGIVGNMTASPGRQINITGTLAQHNWVSLSDCNNIQTSGLDSIFKSVFTDDKYASLRYTYNGTTYVNTGILSLSSDFGSNAVSGAPSNYSRDMAVSATIGNSSGDGYVWAPAGAGTLSDTDMKYHDTVYEWESKDQGTSYIPGSFNATAAGLTAENGVLQIEYENGSSYTLPVDTVNKLFSATKYGKDLSYTVKMNNTDYTGKNIVFNETASQNYTITFTVTDNLVYDKDGKLTGSTYEVTKDLSVFATVVDKGADAPTFTFYYGTNGSASAGTPHTTQPTKSYTSTIKQVGETYYIMPNVSATTANAIGSQTVDGVTVYYPIVDGINVRSGSGADYDFTRYYPVFKAVKIFDNGTEYTYDGTKEMPATVAWVSATIDSGNGASALNDGFGLYNNQYLCKIQKKAGNAEDGGTSVVKYSYTALDGNTYYYYVGYRFYNEDEGGVCVAPDTLVTLADGSKKEIQHVTAEDMLMVRDFYKGEYAAVPAAIIFDHGYDNNTVIKLTFEDGTVVKVVNCHQFVDADLNDYVTITADTAADYIGHSFAKKDGDGYKLVKLLSAEVSQEYVQAFGIISALHYNVLVEDMFSADYMPTDLGLFNYFRIGDGMKFDEAQMQADIEKYGLYAYEDFADYLTEEQFEAFNVKYMKVAVGKGQYTYEGILKLIEEYLGEAK